MITPILIYFLKVNLALAFLYICYRLLFRDDTFFRLRRGVLLSIYLIAFLYPLPDLSGWLSTQTSVAGIVGYYSGLLPKETVLTASNEIAASDWKEAGLKVMQVIWLAGAGLLLSRCLAELFTVSRLHRKFRHDITCVINLVFFRWKRIGCFHFGNSSGGESSRLLDNLCYLFIQNTCHRIDIIEQ